MQTTATIQRQITATARISGGLNASAEVIKGGNVEYYDGDYEITPSASSQTISIEGLTARQDIVINPIPSNYGEIVWDGSIITVR